MKGIMVIIMKFLGFEIQKETTIYLDLDGEPTICNLKIVGSPTDEGYVYFEITNMETGKTVFSEGGVIEIQNYYITVGAIDDYGDNHLVSIAIK